MPKLVQLDKPSSHKRKRSTQKQRALKVRDASLLLAKGFVRADIVPLLMRKYECSRAILVGHNAFFDHSFLL